MLGAIADRYPISHYLEDGAKVTCSLMSSSDREELSNFLARLTRYDLLYLQTDITQPDIQELWLDSIAKEKSVCICAYDPARLVGYASVQISDNNGRRNGEIRVNISQGYRSRGLGRVLISEIFNISKHIKLEILTARMLSDQYGAQAAFKRLGFVRKKVLENYIVDPSGTSKDLLVMTSNLQTDA